MRTAFVHVLPFVLSPFAAAVSSAHLDWESIHTLAVPAPVEDGWRSIPWRTDLWEARREAAQKGKPLFLWEMDGHPLGCT